MQLTERRSEGLLRVYDVVAPAAELEQKLVAKIEEVRPRMRINGFRPGKVPASHIRKIYGPSMMQDIINETVQSSTKEALDKAKIRPASEPTLELKSDLAQVTEGKADLAFELSLEVMPDFEPADLASISIKRPVAAVSDAQVQEAIEELAKNHTTYEDKSGAAADGDSLTIDFSGSIDGVKFEGGTAEDAQVVIGAKRFIPGFEEQLIGAKAGDERTLNVTFPEDYAVDTLKGKAAAFETKIKAVRAPRSGAPDDKWAAELGFDSLASLKEALRARIEADHGAQSRAKAKRALFDVLDERHSFDLPPRMVQAEFDSIWRQIEADKAADQLDPADAAKSDEELRTEYRRIAERRVRLGLLLAEIGRRNKVEVAEDDLRKELAKLAGAYPGQERAIIEAYQRNPRMMDQLRAQAYEEKVVSYVLELVKVTNEDVSRDELFRDDDAEVGAPAETTEAAKPARKKKAKAAAEGEASE